MIIQTFIMEELILIQKQPTLENGEIGVFLIEETEATVKKFRQENNLVILEPMSSNPEHHAQIYDVKKIGCYFSLPYSFCLCIFC